MAYNCKESNEYAHALFSIFETINVNGTSKITSSYDSISSKYGLKAAAVSIVTKIEKSQNIEYKEQFVNRTWKMN